MALDPSIYDECQTLFVERNLNPTQIAAMMAGKPSRATISGWSNAVGDDGQSWHDLRAQRAGDAIHRMTPRSAAEKILRQIDQLLSGDTLDSKQGNTLIQLNRTLKDLSGPAFMVPAMYEVLTDLLLYLREHSPHLLTEDFLEAVRAFKSVLRMRLGEPARRILEGR